MATALLWHLHQPEYRDPVTGVPCMPWTRLHALRGYRDLLVETVESGVPWTLNIVPGLWEQLLYYVDGGSDAHLDLTRRPADGLTAEEQRTVLQTFPCGHPAMRSAPRYRELEARIQAGHRLNTAELRDLQVWSTLAWFGATAHRDFPVLTELVHRGQHFTTADKQALLLCQDQILQAFPHLLRRLAATDGPSLCTSPLHHPILPLLIDLGHAARSVDAAPSVAFAYPEDALRQLVEGRRLLESHAGHTIRGCWPSEGAVSPELIPILAEAGFRWVASDEEVLNRSVREGAGEGGWDLGHGVIGFFRDRALSDRIGFDYAGWETEAAVEDFVERAASPGVKLVALDGENPWESYADAGAGFRAGIIRWLLNNGTVLDAAAELPPVGQISRLHTGSWIGANLEIWAGSRTDHRAWALLAAARRDAGVEAAMPHLLAAEGSDWFWWYGPEFDTPFAGTFDLSFRMHLIAAYEAAGLAVPSELNEPVETPSLQLVEPARAIGGGDTPLGWLGAGEWVLPQGAMAQGGGRVVRYGWDLQGVLWLEVPQGVEVVLNGVTYAVGVHELQAGQEVLLRVGAQHVQLWRRDWVV